MAGDPDFWIYDVDGAWRATVWAAADAPGGPSLRRLPVAVVAQSDLGALWRYDLETAAPTRVDAVDATLAVTEISW